MESWQQQVADLARSGHKIEAIKIYREATGANLLDAKNFVEELERTLATGEFPTASVADAGSDVTDEMLLDLVRQGQRIQAIKLYCAREQVGLAEGLAAVNQLAAQAGISVPKSGCLGVLLMALVSLPLVAILVTVAVAEWR